MASGSHDKSHEASDHASQFIELSAGRTHYKDEGVGIPILLVHGATVGLWEFDPIVPYLQQRGFRTIRLDLYGHGISERPRRRYDIHLFRHQLDEFLSELKLEGAINLFLGHSMGAAALSACLQDKHRRLPVTSKAILVAPLLEHASKISMRRLLRVPILGGAVMETVGRRLMSKRRIGRLHAAGQSALLPNYLNQIGMPGHWRALRGVICEGALSDHSNIYRALGRRQRLDVSLIWGDADAVIPKSDIDQVRQLSQAAQYFKLPGLEHNLLLIQPELIADLVAKIAASSRPDGA